jgi:IS30 family transposase
MSHYLQPTYEQQFQLSTLKNRGFSEREIAACIVASQSSVSRELGRSKDDRGYRYKQAQK